MSPTYIHTHIHTYIHTYIHNPQILKEGQIDHQPDSEWQSDRSPEYAATSGQKHRNSHDDDRHHGGTSEYVYAQDGSRARVSHAPSRTHQHVEQTTDANHRPKSANYRTTTSVGAGQSGLQRVDETDDVAYEWSNETDMTSKGGRAYIDADVRFDHVVQGSSGQIHVEHHDLIGGQGASSEDESEGDVESEEVLRLLDERDALLRTGVYCSEVSVCMHV